MKSWDGSPKIFRKSALAKDRKLAAGQLVQFGQRLFQAGKSEPVKSYQEKSQIERIRPGHAGEPEARPAIHEKPAASEEKPGKDKDKDKDKEVKGQGHPEQAKAQESEKKENAKRILKGASGEEGNRPNFKPQSKIKKG